MIFFRVFKILKKLLFIIVIIFFLIFLLSRGHVYGPEELEYGVTFSKKQADALGLNWQKTYLEIINDLGVKKLRLSAYWDEIESSQNNFNFEFLDWQIEKAQQNNIEVILAIGARLPRWPECHLPDWAKNLSQDERNNKLLDHIDRTIKRYTDKKSIIAWQIENEPFLTLFGECTQVDKDFLDTEIALARSLNNRPIVVTDSGELSIWVNAAKRADIFGTTMYLKTYSKELRSYINYPIKPGFFRFKKNIVQIFAHPEKWIVIELQGEPWSPIAYQFITPEERARTMDLKKFKNIIQFSSKTGFKEFYLWGVEWWYWEKETQNNPGLWEEARKLF